MYNLSDIHGRKVLTGMDTDGNHWSQFELDYLGMESKELDTCTECENTVGLIRITLRLKFVMAKYSMNLNVHTIFLKRNNYRSPSKPQILTLTPV